MYIQNIFLENIGPLSRLNIDLPFDATGKPQPLVLVGKNGSGKTIILAHLVNTLLSMKGIAFHNNEVKEGRVYKLRSPSYVQTGQDYFFGKITFNNGFFSAEWQLSQKRTKGDFEESLGYCPQHREWASLPADQMSHFAISYEQKKKEIENIFGSNCCVYLPSDRFEEPGWANIADWLHAPVFDDPERISGRTNRKIIQRNSLAEIKNWLMDVLFDQLVYETERLNVTVGNGPIIPAWFNTNGRNYRIRQHFNTFLNTLLEGSGSLRLGFGDKYSRTISIQEGDEKKIPSVFNLSSGELALFNIYASIIRDYDLTGSTLSTMTDIQGVVMIDEIDLHLHTRFQVNVLPQLIGLFPNVQFIITTHSPFFLLGMRDVFGEGGFQIRELPTGNIIGTECFGEFEEAFNTLKATQQFETELSKHAQTSQKPIVYMEGPTDVKYLRQAAKHLNKTELLAQVDLQPISDQVGTKHGGSSWLNKAKDLFSAKPNMIQQKVLLIYDPDENIVNKTVAEKVFVRGLSKAADSPLGDANGKNQGIESLFPKPFIDSIPSTDETSFFEEHTRRRGQTIVNQALIVMKDRKVSLCDWICDNAKEEDFDNFQQIFSMIEEVIMSVEKPYVRVPPHGDTH